MKFATTLLPLAVVSTAFVIPDEELTNQIIIESSKKPQNFLDRISGNIDSVWSGVEETFKDTVAFSENAIDNAISAASEISEKAKTTFECHHSMSFRPQLTKV